jgi:plastocyanin
MKKVAALLLVALASLALVACGGDDDGDTSAAPPAETTAESTTGGGSEGGASVVAIEAAEGTDLAYNEQEVTAKAGDVSIEFTNPQSLSHDVVVEDASGKELGRTELIADDKTTTTIAGLKPGKDTFYCSVPGHREAGMEGTLTVE